MAVKVIDLLCARPCLQVARLQALAANLFKDVKPHCLQNFDQLVDYFKARGGDAGRAIMGAQAASMRVRLCVCACACCVCRILRPSTIPPRPHHPLSQILFSKENMNTRNSWWHKARLWQLVFTQADEGFWEPTDASAFALMASLQPPSVESFARMGLVGLVKRLQFAVQLWSFGKSNGATNVDRLAHLHAEDTDGVAAPVLADPSRVNDPLAFQWEAITFTVPVELRDIIAKGPGLEFGGAEAEGRTPEEARLAWAHRVWTTVLCVIFLEGHDVCWLRDAEAELTTVDVAQAWLDEQQRLSPELKEAMKTIVEKGRQRLAAWAIVQDQRITDIRWLWMDLRFGFRKLLLQSAAFVGHSARIRHDTLGAIVGPLMFRGFRKWQRWCLVCSFVLMALTVEVWCAAPARSLLSASCAFRGVACTRLLNSRC